MHQRRQKHVSIPISILAVCARDGEWYRAVGADSLRAYQIRGETLLVLGFALVELCLGRTLEEMRSDKDMNPNEISARRNTANRGIEDVYNEAGDHYGKIVQTCLQFLIDMRDLILENQDFQEAVYEDVLMPLVNDLKAFQGK